MGPLSSVDVDRLVVERVVLTGYPVRVHKRTTVVKRMFYNAEGPSITQTGEGGLSGGYLDGCQDGGRPKNPGRSLPSRVSGRRAAQNPRSVLTQTGEGACRSLPKRERANFPGGT